MTKAAITSGDLEQHRLWSLTYGLQGVRIERSWTDLRGSDLSRANLRGSDLSRANLSRANLSEADLSRANLSRADLSRANLRGSDLSEADLYGWKIGAAGNPIICVEFAHDWPLLLIRHVSGIGIVCGCRRFETRADAERHWEQHADRQRRNVVLPALDAAFHIARAQGWL